MDLPLFFHVSDFQYTAHEVGKLPLRFECAAVACAPEAVFSRVVEKIDNPPMEPPTDIWGLGTAVCL